MGTNYYVAKDKCDCCGRYDEEYHIGKSSYGWAFTFQGYPHDNLKSWADYKEFLKDKTIVNEYRDVIPYDEFVKFVELEKSPDFVNASGRKNLLHNEQGRNDVRPWFNSQYDWDDEEGYSFSSREFS